MSGGSSLLVLLAVFWQVLVILGWHACDRIIRHLHGLQGAFCHHSRRAAMQRLKCMHFFTMRYLPTSLLSQVSNVREAGAGSELEQ